ncbi:hypothetical protein FI667_g12323, partial [Globisporangium splendens]
MKLKPLFLSSLFSVWFVLGVLLGSYRATSVVDAACATARLRKSYGSLTVDEKLLYRRALQTAMDKGLYIKFVEMHTERMSEMEAHRGCMFAYWHRAFLIGFENMLRRLASEFECITIPYWDEMQHNARALTGACSSVESCAPMLRDWGGSSSGNLSQSIKINGAWVSGYRWVDRQPLNHFCQASSVTGAACAKCLPRGNMQQTVFPSGTNFASVSRQLFTNRDFITTTKNVEDGMHNAIHAALGGAMATSQSPSDPIFWSHHCRAGLGKLTDQQKQSNQYSFLPCPHREDSGSFTATSTFTMRAGENGVDPKQVNQNGQVIYPFFKDIPSQYYKLADITTLGVNKYNYQVSGLVGQMAVNCETTSTSRRLHEDHGDDKTAKRSKCRSELDDSDKSESAPTQGESSYPEQAFAVDTSLDSDVDAGKVLTWIEEVKKLYAELPEDKSKDPEKDGVVFELERMVCMFYDQCRGGIADYPDEFKAAFNVTEPPPCKPIVDAINSECKPLRLSNWKEMMEKYFPCSALQGVENVSVASDLPGSSSSSSSRSSTLASGAY